MELLIERLRAIVGADGVITSGAALATYESDASQDRGAPTVVVLPRSTGEVAAVVRVAHEQGLPIVPRGAGTGLSGGAVAVEGGVVLTTTRLNRIRRVDLANRIAVVEPGVVNAELTNRVAPHGLYYAPDPSSQPACTIGGNVAENAGRAPTASPTASPPTTCWPWKRCSFPVVRSCGSVVPHMTAQATI